MLLRVALVRTDVSEELNSSIRNIGSYKSHTALRSQKTTFFIVTAVKNSNLT
jgi:hypothetical protein